MEIIHLVTAANNNYAQYLAVMLNSLLENKVSENPISIYIIDSNISSRNKKRLNRALQKFKQKATYLKVDASEYNGCLPSGHLSQESFYRYSIPDLLDKQIKKAIYLDCDLIIKEDISKLWNIKLGDYHLAAVEVPEQYIYWLDNRLPIPKHSYFNNGVMVMNLVKWRESNIKSKVINFIRNNHWRTPARGQDGGNAILHDKWLRLDPKWNYYSVLAKKHTDKPAIIHYAGKIKPWKDEQCPLKEEYFKYLNTTVWK